MKDARFWIGLNTDDQETEKLQDALVTAICEETGKMPRALRTLPPDHVLRSTKVIAALDAVMAQQLARH